MKSLRWGLIGATWIARDRMIRAFRATNGEVDTVLSSSSERARSYAEANGIPRATTDLDELLASNIDAVYISTTNELHVPQAMAAIAAGKHVLCEKPLATDLVAAETMVRAARVAGVVFATNHHLRNSGTHLAMRAAIVDERIGKPLFARVSHARHLPDFLQGWRLHNPEKGGGVVLDITTHDVDSLRFLLGEEPVSVVCMTQTGTMSKGTVEDGAMTLLEFESGILAQTHECFSTPTGTTGIEILGTRGSLIATDCMNQDPIGEVLLRTADDEVTLEIDRSDLYERGVAAFVSAVGGNGAPAATGEDGLRSLAVGLAALESSRTGTRISIALPTPKQVVGQE